jgi:hypothetical protein
VLKDASVETKGVAVVLAATGLRGVFLGVDVAGSGYDYAWRRPLRRTVSRLACPER